MLADYSLEIKSIHDDGVFEGYASVFNVIDDMQDVILPGAFQGNVTKKIKLLWQHNQDMPIGKILHLYEDNNGLYVKAQLILDIQQGREAYSLLKSDVVNGLSIGYVVKSHSTDSKTGIRRVEKIDLWEISLVTFPANSFAIVGSYKSLCLALSRACLSLKSLKEIY